MCSTVKSASQKAWDLIDMLRHRDGVKMRDLAECAGVSLNTVCADAKNPDNIPFGRLMKYFSYVGVDPDEMIKHAAVSAISDN